MLVLTRKEQQAIRIGDDIVITVYSVGSDRVRIGISAPKDVPIMRAELLEQTNLADQAVNR